MICFKNNPKSRCNEFLHESIGKKQMKLELPLDFNPYMEKKGGNNPNENGELEYCYRDENYLFTHFLLKRKQITKLVGGRGGSWNFNKGAGKRAEIWPTRPVE